MNIFLKTTVVSLLICSVVGCANPGKITGGGKLIGYDGFDIAAFGFNGDTCDGDLNNPTGHFNFVDQEAGVKMNGSLEAHGVCVDPDQWEGEWLALDCIFSPFPYPVHLVVANYRSTKPRNRGEGQFLAYVKDNGEGGKASGDDQMQILVFSGPFAGYLQEGVVQGNVKDHTCEEEDD